MRITKDFLEEPCIRIPRSSSRFLYSTFNNMVALNDVFIALLIWGKEEEEEEEEEEE